MNEYYENLQKYGIFLSDGLIHNVQGSKFIKMILGKFLEDKNMSVLKDGIREKDVKKAFMAAHTLKGVTANLGMNKLNEKICEIVEILRQGQLEGAEEKFKSIKEEYIFVCKGIEEVYNE